jgi:hypothetical protein
MSVAARQQQEARQLQEARLVFADLCELPGAIPHSFGFRKMQTSRLRGQ